MKNWGDGPIHDRNQPAGNGRAHGIDRVRRPLALSWHPSSSAVESVISLVLWSRPHGLQQMLGLY